MSVECTDYCSVDMIFTDDPSDADNFSLEFLNTLTMVHNIDKHGMCNGTHRVVCSDISVLKMI